MTLSPEFSFVVEDDNSVVGFVAAAANAKELQRQIRVAWVPEMQTKYPELFHSHSTEKSNIPDPIKVICSSFAFYFILKGCLIQDLATKLQRLHTEDLPDALLTYHPSQLKMWLSDTVIDHSVSKRLLTCAVAALRAHGKPKNLSYFHLYKGILYFINRKALRAVMSTMSTFALWNSTAAWVLWSLKM